MRRTVTARGILRRSPQRAAGSMAAAGVSAMKSISQSCHVWVKMKTPTNTARSCQSHFHDAVTTRSMNPPPQVRVRKTRARGRKSLRMKGRDRAGPAICTVRHPAAAALGEVVVHPRLTADPHQEARALQRRHELGIVERDAGLLSRAEAEERLLLHHVPPRVPGAPPVRHPEAGEGGLAEEVVRRFHQGLDRD